MTLKEARLNAGYTQADMGEMLGLTMARNMQGSFYCPVYSRWETGRTIITAAAYLRICKILRVNPGELEPPSDVIVKKKRGRNCHEIR